VASYLELGPAAISLSSGIDSVSVAVFAAEVAARSGQPLPHGLSVHFADPACDESAGQRAVAGALEMPFCLLSFEDCLGGRPLLEATMELAPRYPSPLMNMWEPLYCHLVDVARSRGIRAILTGTGGDEWLGVTPLLAADLIRAGDWGGLWRLYRTQLRSYPLSALPFARNILWQFGFREVLKDAAHRHAPGYVARRRQPVELPSWIAPDPELRGPLRERLQPPAPRPTEDSVYVRELRPALQHAVVAMELEEFYYRGRGRGVSYYHPYWTRPMVEFLLRTPPTRLNEGGRSKGMVRRLLAERLPGLDFQRQKKFTVTRFYHGLVEQQQPALWARWAADSALASAGVVDARLLGTVMRAAATGQVGHAGDAASWLSTEAWLRGQG
jgi:asparagine synthetase B (glutamine-hydrolysing)